MSSDNPNHTKTFYTEFQSLGYEKRVYLYDKHIGITPFAFPQPDAEVSWVTNEKMFNTLVQLFNQDTRGKNYYAHQIVINGEKLSFDIRPVTLKQRIFLNGFIIKKNLQEGQDFVHEARAELNKAANKHLFLASKIDELTNTIDRIKIAGEKTNDLVKSRFLKIFYHGYLGFQSGCENLLKVRRTFTELWVYSYGIRIAVLLTFLKQELQDNYSVPGHAPLNLQQKIVLLEQLGIIDFLEQKFKKIRRSEYKMELAQLISLLLIDERSKYPKILKCLDDLENRTYDDLMLKNLDSVRRELAKVSFL